METERSWGGKSTGKNDPSWKTRLVNKILNGAQISMRMIVVVTSAISAYLMLTAKENIVVYGIPLSANYRHTPAFKYLGYMCTVASVFGVTSLIITLKAIRHGNIPITYLLLFLHDLLMMGLLVGGCAAATAMGHVGKHGVREAGWMPICIYVGRFCNRITISVMLGFVSAIFYQLLCIISFLNSRNTHVSSTTTAA